VDTLNWRRDDASDENDEMKVKIPEDLLISDTTNLLMSLIDFVYPNLNDNLGDPLFFQERGILAPTLDSVEHVNEYMMSLIQANGLCNGTRLTVTHLGKSTIVATVITGKRAGTKVFIPKMNLIPSDPGLPFKFKHR